MAITASMVKELRDRTGIAMMKCKKALDECDGDLEAAVDLLRKQGLATASKKSDRATNCGGVGLAMSETVGFIVSLTCETDFVSGNDVFKGFLSDIAQAALDNDITDVETLKSTEMGGTAIHDLIVEKISQLGENMQLASISKVEGAAIAGYLHSNGQLATMVVGDGDVGVLRNVAMHIAAAAPAPQALTRDGICADLIAKEREIIGDSDEIKNKPENIQPKIIDGKMNKFFKELVLLEQEMLVDSDKGNVESYAKGKGISITDFARVGG
ncbi:MAG: translation elongation factor Ts [Planctomycetes bacterium]|nr:translation elongation factor Ts [Planctomycetota bacterium]